MPTDEKISVASVETSTAIISTETADSVTSTKTLEQLADEFNEEVKQSNLHYQQSFIHYVNAGKCLIEIRERLKKITVNLASG